MRSMLYRDILSPSSQHERGLPVILGRWSTHIPVFPIARLTEDRDLARSGQVFSRHSNGDHWYITGILPIMGQPVAPCITGRFAHAPKYLLYSSGVFMRRKVACAWATIFPEESKILRSMALSALPSR